MTELCGVPAERIALVWPAIEPLIKGAASLSRGKFSADDIRAGLESRDMQLWMAWDNGPVAVAVTQIAEHPRKKTCRIRIVTGRYREGWQHYIRAIEAWAASNGCTGMELIARPGWERVLRSYGYEKTHVLLEREIDHA